MLLLRLDLDQIIAQVLLLLRFIWDHVAIVIQLALVVSQCSKSLGGRHPLIKEQPLKKVADDHGEE